MMQELEKILEEIEKEQRSYEADHAWNYAKGLEYAASIIRKHMNDGWIPIDEDNIPDHEVLACDKYGNELIGYIDIVGYGFFCEEGESGICMYDVVAWMEKPEPYKPERNNNV